MTSSIRIRSSASGHTPKPDSDARTPLYKAEERLLHYYHELDEWQQDNHFIRSGYVRETKSYKKCIESLFYLHNETVNIYSHLLPSLVVLGSIFYYINFVLEIYPNYLGIWEKLNFVQFGVALTSCLFMSSSFHCMKAHSQKISKFGNQLDYFGIVILITSSLISIILFAFYDHTGWKYTFVGVFFVLASICTLLTLDPKFATNAYRPLRSLMFILFGLSGIFPIGVAISLYGLEDARERSGAFWLVLEGFFYILGAILYAFRFPERLCHVDQDLDELLENPKSGKFDYFGHAHQIFHCMVVVAAFCHWKALVECYHYLHKVTLYN